MKARNAVLAILLAAVPAWTAGQIDKVSISLYETGGGSYEVTGQFLVPVPRSAAWAVLTDYENIEDFVSSVVSSRVAERNKGGALIEQVSIGKVLFFSKRVSLRLRLQETPLNEVTFKEMSRKDFEFYEGRWSLQEMPAGCRVIYNLKARPKFLVPLWLARNAFRSSGQDLLTEIKDEILRRADASTIKPLNPARDLVADFKNSESL